jgi:hypothetical protein
VVPKFSHSANSVTEILSGTLANYSALSAVNLNKDGSLLTARSALNGPDREEWLTVFGEEIDRLVDTKTAKFVHRHQIPSGKAISYYNPQLKVKMKDGKLVKRVRGTVGGDKLPYSGPSSAQTAALETVRILLNAIVSEGAEMMTLDIKDFYLGTPMDQPEFMRVPLKYIPPTIQTKYKLASYVKDNYVFMQIDKTLYGLVQSGILSQQRLIEHLSNNGYKQAKNTPCLFIHESNGNAFTLVVDDFLVKSKDESSQQHLIDTLHKMYTITIDKALKQKYIGITIDYNKQKRYMDLSMPGYVDNALTRFGANDLRGVNSPLVYVPPTYGPQTQIIKDESTKLPSLTPAQLLRLQEVVGVFLYYSRAVDPLMITAINKIGSSQSNADISILDKVQRFLQYASRYKDAKLRIHASDMQLQVHSDASYLSETKSRSRAGAFMFLGKLKPNQRPNAPITYLSTIISTVVDSATAAEYAALFIAAQVATSLRLTLADLGYPQKSTTIICDNECAVGIANDSFTQKRSKTIDMRYHWIRDQVKLKNFKVDWRPGNENLADFFTKAHPVNYHLKMMNIYTVTDQEGVLEPGYIPSNNEDDDQ